eukprot:m.81275 g.81275  ORF g.81275 m.81275 type:complete len:665 (-) comp12628_c0_seq2:458-2452(-)
MFSLAQNAFQSCRPPTVGEVTLGILGIDKSGKSSFAARLLGEPLDEVRPTIGQNVHELTRRRINVKLYDLGGGAQIRDIWQHYYAEMHAVIFVVDASAPSHRDTHATLTAVANHKYITGKPFLILANKQDMGHTMTLTELDFALNLAMLSRSVVRVAPISARDSTMKELFAQVDWLLKTINNQATDLLARRESDLEEYNQQLAMEQQQRRERIAERRRQREAEEAAEEAREQAAAAQTKGNGVQMRDAQLVEETRHALLPGAVGDGDVVDLVSLGGKPESRGGDGTQGHQNQRPPSPQSQLQSQSHQDERHLVRAAGGDETLDETKPPAQAANAWQGPSANASAIEATVTTQSATQVPMQQQGQGVETGEAAPHTAKSNSEGEEERKGGSRDGVDATKANAHSPADTDSDVATLQLESPRLPRSVVQVQPQSIFTSTPIARRSSVHQPKVVSVKDVSVDELVKRVAEASRDVFGGATLPDPRSIVWKTYKAAVKQCWPQVLKQARKNVRFSLDRLATQAHLGWATTMLHVWDERTYGSRPMQLTVAADGSWVAAHFLSDEAYQTYRARFQEAKSDFNTLSEEQKAKHRLVAEVCLHLFLKKNPSWNGLRIKHRTEDLFAKLQAQGHCALPSSPATMSTAPTPIPLPTLSLDDSIHGSATVETAV